MQFEHSFKLILAGNTNIPAMINAIIRATLQARDDFQNDKLIFHKIYVFHTEQSLQSLMTSSLKWREALAHYGIAITGMIHHVTTLEESTTERFDDLVGQLRDIVNPLDHSKYYVDLTGGISALKTILAVFSYVLDIEHLYSMEIRFSNDSTERRRQMGLFYNELEKEKDVQIEYRKFPAIRQFDAFGRLNYTEVVRHRQLVDDLTKQLSSVLPFGFNEDFLRISLLSGTNARLIGEVTGQPDSYRQSVFSFASAVEETANALLTYLTNNSLENKTLGDKLADLREQFAETPKYFVNAEILKHLTMLINEVRNNIIHPSTNSNRDLEAIQSHLASQLTLTLLRFTIKTLSSFVNQEGDLVHIALIDPKQENSNYIYYFGFDGDATGDYLESAFIDMDEASVLKKSQTIHRAIDQLKKVVWKESRNHEAVLFAEGDNILFKAPLNYSLLLKLQEMYTQCTGLNSSIGYGKTLHEATIALRLAKAERGNSIIGIALHPHYSPATSPEQ